MDSRSPIEVEDKLRGNDSEVQKMTVLHGEPRPEKKHLTDMELADII